MRQPRPTPLQRAILLEMALTGSVLHRGCQGSNGWLWAGRRATLTVVGLHNHRWIAPHDRHDEAARHGPDDGGVWGITFAGAAAAAITVDEWNARVPVGTPVVYLPWRGYEQEDVVVSCTRSRAWPIARHASVMIEGTSGGVNLSHLIVTGSAG